MVLPSQLKTVVRKVAITQMERLARESERLGEREASIDTEVQANQAKLNELNGQLDALMRELKGP